jgi:Phage Tail Protein X.
MVNPRIVNPGGIKSSIVEGPPFEQDAYWLWLAQPQPQRVYISTQDDWWDMIAIRTYGQKRGNEHLMFRLLEANYNLREVAHFPAGLAVVVPPIDVTSTEIPLVPWKSATQLPSP